ncbi:hypothetical protein ACFP3I_24605 [Chryseobacterium arachidis]
MQNNNLISFIFIPPSGGFFISVYLYFKISEENCCGGFTKSISTDEY